MRIVDSLKRIFITITLVMCSLLTQAQLYDGLERTCDTITYNGGTYIKQDYIDLFTVIGNAEDEFFDVKQLMKDGTTPARGYITRENRPIDMSQGQARALNSIIDNSFSQEQVEQIVDEHEIIIHVNISSTTGLPTGVSFTYYLNSGYENIPMSVWQNIETRIMNEFCFTITDVGKNLNHNSIVWSQCPKGRAEAVAEEEPEEETNDDEKETEIEVVTPVRGTVGKGTITPTINRGSIKGTVVTP